MGKSLAGKELGKGISQRADGLFVARLMVNGKTKVVSSRSLVEARRKLKELKSESESTLNGNATVEQWYRAFYEDVKSRTVKTEAHAHRLNGIAEGTYLKYIGSRPVAKVRKVDIQRATNTLLEEKGYTTVLTGLSEMRQTFRYAIDNDVIDKNPCTRIVMDKTKRVRRKAESLDDWEIELFFKTIKHKAFRYAARVMLLTGMRIGEMTALTWSDIDFENKQIHVTKNAVYGMFDGSCKICIDTPKTENGVRTIPFIGNIEEVLNEWKVERLIIHKKLLAERNEKYDESKHDLVFITERGSMCTNQNFNAQMRKVTERMQDTEDLLADIEEREPRKVKKLHSHMFRHTFVTKCGDANMNLSYVGKIVGHASYAMTMKYTHTTAEHMEEEVRKLAGVFDF